MLRITTGLLFTIFFVLGVFGLTVLFVKGGDIDNFWISFASAGLVFVTSCIGLIILITTKVKITMNKQSVSVKQPDHIKTVNKAKRK